jgi:DNA helicase INO80
MYVADRHAEYHRQESAMSPEVKSLFLHGLPSNEAVDLSLSPRLLGGLEGSHPSKGWSYIDIPDKERLITDSHKMVVLDRLLTRLKLEGHRVLIYSQMTKMIDLLEEFMTHRRHKYIRLDGSSRISERRDMVNDFQTKSEIFVFLLSTRAGGLGINLTAADTVIFYDSDWNPTVDQQAMDRAHRLGQTKQVTVYRLIVKGSIEERILQRAHEKSEIQKMVISGGDFKIDTLKPKEVVSLILDDEEMETRFLAKQAEKKAQEESIKQRNATNRKRKNTTKKPAEGSPLVKKAQPAAACSISPSPTPSRPPSVTSFTTNDTVNGEYIDVVGGVETELVTRPPINNNTPPRATNKRSRRGGTKGNNSSKRIKLMNQMTPSHQLVHNNGTGHAPH